jgi:acetyl-CoA carboxylase carboxyltransferase component
MRPSDLRISAVAAQRRRRSFDDLARNTPGDGVVTGFGLIKDGSAEVQCALIACKCPASSRSFFSHLMICRMREDDYTVLAGTQGAIGHRKHDRLLHIAQDLSVPVVLYGEGGGGRPGDVDAFEVRAGPILGHTLVLQADTFHDS